MLDRREFVSSLLGALALGKILPFLQRPAPTLADLARHNLPDHRAVVVEMLSQSNELLDDMEFVGKTYNVRTVLPTVQWRYLNDQRS